MNFAELHDAYKYQIAELKNSLNNGDISSEEYQNAVITLLNFDIIKQSLSEKHAEVIAAKLIYQLRKFAGISPR